MEFRAPRVQRNRKFVDAAQYTEDYALHPEGHSVSITTRGKPFTMGNWEGAVLQHGKPNDVRYGLTQWLNDGERLVTVTDEGGEESLEIYHVNASQEPVHMAGLDIGKPVALTVSPKADQAVLSNHQLELILVDLETKGMRVLDKSQHERIVGIA